MIRRVVLFLAALFLATALSLSAQEIEPQTVAVKVDLLEMQEPVHLYRVCGSTLKPIGFAEAGVVTEITVRVVDLYCVDGVLFLDGGGWTTQLPLRDLQRYDQAGRLGALLICPTLLQTDYFIYAGSRTHRTCAEARSAEE